MVSNQLMLSPEVDVETGASPLQKSLSRKNVIGVQSGLAITPFHRKGSRNSLSNATPSSVATASPTAAGAPAGTPRVLSPLA